MHNFVNKENVKSSEVDFTYCRDLVNQDARPKLVSEMVSEAVKTGQLPNSSMLPPLNTYTEDIDSLDIEVSGDDKIDSYGRMQQVMQLVEDAEKKSNKAKDAYNKAVKDAKEKEMADAIKKNSAPPTPLPAQ